jgi:DNA-binding LacI/PurR family transcriptional regulator
MDVIRLAEQQDLRVPNDLAVVGFDNSDLAPIYRVPLTTVEQPLAEVGKTAAKLLLERLGGITSETRCSYLRGMLIVRKSCGSRLNEY